MPLSHGPSTPWRVIIRRSSWTATLVGIVRQRRLAVHNGHRDGSRVPHTPPGTSTRLKAWRVELDAVGFLELMQLSGLLVRKKANFSVLLAGVGPDRDLAEVEEPVTDDWPSSVLYRAVRQLPQVLPAVAAAGRGCDGSAAPRTRRAGHSPGCCAAGCRDQWTQFRVAGSRSSTPSKCPRA